MEVATMSACSVSHKARIPPTIANIKRITSMTIYDIYIYIYKLHLYHQSRHLFYTEQHHT